MKLSHITGEVIRAAINVHSTLGPGLLESAYRTCLYHELISRGLKVQTEVALPVSYNGVTIDVGYRIDVVVEQLVLVELKTVPRFSPVHVAQLLSYLRLGNYPVGLLMNFHVSRLRNGIRRVVN
jgi:GxxExxY protein